MVALLREQLLLGRGCLPPFLSQPPSLSASPSLSVRQRGGLSLDSITGPSEWPGKRAEKDAKQLRRERGDEGFPTRAPELSLS